MYNTSLSLENKCLQTYTTFAVTKTTSLTTKYCSSVIYMHLHQSILNLCFLGQIPLLLVLVCERDFDFDLDLDLDFDFLLLVRCFRVDFLDLEQRQVWDLERVLDV